MAKVGQDRSTLYSQPFAAPLLASQSTYPSASSSWTKPSCLESASDLGTHCREGGGGGQRNKTARRVTLDRRVPA